MSYTDRELLKQQEAGAFCTTGATDPIGEVNKFHRRTRSITLVSTANAATAVAETVGFIVPRKSKLADNTAIKLLVATTNVATSNSNYDSIIVYKRDSAGANQVRLGTWNTHGGAQGTLTFNVPATVPCVTNAQAIIAAGSIITYEVTKTSSGVAIDPGTIISLDLEEC